MKHRTFLSGLTILAAILADWGAGARFARADEAAEARVKGMQLFAAKRHDEARRWLDRALELNPRDDLALATRGLMTWFVKFDRLQPLNEVLKSSQQALDDADEALRLNPNSAEAYFLRGLLCRRFGRYEQSIASHKKALAIDPNHKRAEYHIESTRQAYADVLKGKLWPPLGDLPKLAREGPQRPEGIEFWLKHGQRATCFMQQESREFLPNGDERVTTKTVSLESIRIMVPREKFFPLSIYLPLQKGEILHPYVRLNCPPYIAIFHSEASATGNHPEYVKERLEWLYWKTGFRADGKSSAVAPTNAAVNKGAVTEKASAQAAAKLEGTRWQFTGNDPNGQYVTVEFRAGGEFVFDNPPVKGRWRQQGDSVTMMVGEETFQVRVEGDSMKGTWRRQAITQDGDSYETAPTALRRLK